MNKDYSLESLQMHYDLKGKIEIASRARVDSKEALSLAYTPGVAKPCLEIQKDPDKNYELTRRWNTVAVVTDGTAVLGLGYIGPEAGMPVIEGKCVLFKEFGGVDAIPLCIRSKETDAIVETVRLLAGSFGGINLEDISAPRCFEIEKRLKECCDIPIFHDDQHGTAVITLAGLINALKLVGKRLDEVKIVTSGAGGHNLYFVQPFANQLERIDESRQRNDCGSMLIVMKNRNITAFFEAFFNFKASGRGNVFQIDPAKAAGQETDGLYNSIRLFTADTQGNRVHAAEFLEQDAFSFNDRHPRLRADVPQPQDCGAVRNNRNCIPAPGQFIVFIRILLNLQAGLCNAGRIRKTQRLFGIHPCAGSNLYLSLQVIVHL